MCTETLLSSSRQYSSGYFSQTLQARSAATMSNRPQWKAYAASRTSMALTTSRHFRQTCRHATRSHNARFSKIWLSSSVGQTCRLAAGAGPVAMGVADAMALFIHPRIAVGLSCRNVRPVPMSASASYLSSSRFSEGATSSVSRSTHVAAVAPFCLVTSPHFSSFVHVALFFIVLFVVHISVLIGAAASTISVVLFTTWPSMTSSVVKSPVAAATVTASAFADTALSRLLLSSARQHA